MSDMDCSGNMLVEITGIPLELLGLLGLDSYGEPERVVDVDEAGAVEEGEGIAATMTTMAMMTARATMEKSATMTAMKQAVTKEEGSAPSIGLMRRLVIGRRNVECTEQTLTTGAEDRRQMTTPASVPRRMTVQYESRVQPVSWNQHCCGANAVRTHPEPLAARSIVNSRRRHPFDLEPDVIKIR